MRQPRETIDSSSIEQAADFVSAATGLLVLAGAGIGVDSGLPDFRGDSGFWRAYPALRSSETRLTDIASPATFRSDPELAWGFYGHRLRLYRETPPHDGFRILKGWCASMPDGWWVSTTNVDGHFQKAGFTAKYIHECHGSIHVLQCSKPCDTGTWSAASLRPEVDQELRWVGSWPLCRACSDVARPNIRLFGDPAWDPTTSEAQHWKLVEWLPEVERLVIVEIGVGTAIPTLREFGDQLVKRRGARRIRINPRDFKTHDPNSIGISAGAVESLSAIDGIISARLYVNVG